MAPRTWLAVVTLALLAAPALAQPHDQHAGAASEKLGTVHFETSCSPAVRADFDRAVALLHSFWYNAAINAFQGVLKADPPCAIAHWGLALSHWSNPFGGMRSRAALERGAAAVAAGQALGAKTDRERAYLAAVGELFKDFDKVDQRTRILAYENATESVSQKYPNDTEAAIFYALAVNQSALPTDKTYANQLKAAAIYEKLLPTQPDHPGLAHYIIHAYDHPPLADRALNAARRYAKIAPSAPHALHMPSHTFTRVGYWQDSIDTNIASAAAARKDNAAAEELHAMDYQTYAYLQTAQDRAARRVLDETALVLARLNLDAPGAAAPGVAGLYAAATIPARHALERGAWAEASRLTPRASAFPFTDAITHFARALGAARSGNAAAARADIERLAALRNKLVEAKDAYWSEQVDIQRKGAEAWTLLAEGKKTEAAALMREAADQEDQTDKSAISPGPLAPARELLGEMLIELGQPAQALVEFEKTTKKEPNRFRGVYGAARAAELAVDKVKARQYYAQLIKICEGSDSERPELQQARKMVGAKTSSSPRR